MKTIEAVQGEYGYRFEFTLKNADRTVYTLSGETITMRVAKEGESGSQVGTATIYDAANGIVHVAITTSDAAVLTEGQYQVQLWIDDGSKKVATKPITLRVLEAV